jgi:16S rRNA (guanine966-N2)-methyltransferase
MRIIAGKLGGLKFESPRSDRTHPMSDKVRGALFNILGDIEGLSVLDAFSGSGALAYEAVSRGAISVVAIDIDPTAVNIIKKNCISLGLEKQIKAIRSNSASWSENNSNRKFDIVIAAPPYDNIKPNILDKLKVHVNKNGIYVLDWPGKLDKVILDGFNIVSAKKYGDAQLVFYRPDTSIAG